MRMSSTYLLKAKGDMPSAGTRYPWLPRASYFSDMYDAKYGSIQTDMVSANMCSTAYTDIRPVVCQRLEQVSVRATKEVESNIE